MVRTDKWSYISPEVEMFTLEMELCNNGSANSQFNSMVVNEILDEDF